MDAKLRPPTRTPHISVAGQALSRKNLSPSADLVLRYNPNKQNMQLPWSYYSPSCKFQWQSTERGRDHLNVVEKEDTHSWNSPANLPSLPRLSPNHTILLNSVSMALDTEVSVEMGNFN